MHPGYDIRLLVNKGTVDIVRPQWVLDCVARDELGPLKKRYTIKVTSIQFRRFNHTLHRYFFHASDDQRMSAEYDERDKDDEEPSREQDANLKIFTIQRPLKPR